MKLKNFQYLELTLKFPFSYRVDIVDASIRTVETDSTTPAVESFLIGLSPSDIDTKLESKLR